MLAKPAPTHFADLFTPKLITVLREGYGRDAFKADVIAGLTVAIVALPLSMAIAIASGVTPDRGLFTAIAGGFFVSALSGSRFQIGGPAGAFIVLVAATVAKFGVDGLILAVFLSGLIMLAGGFLRLGTFIKYIPYPVTVGFSAGIAVIIAAGQLKDFFGLHLPGAEPGPIIAKIKTLSEAAGTLSWPTLAVALPSLAIIALLKRVRPQWPGMLIAVVGASLAVWALHLPVATIGTRFGGIPNSLPMPHWPVFSLARIVQMLPAAASFALLGSIESLLSAVVADSMSGRRHRSNCELVAQGVANIAASLFGGICVTGTVARTATNVRAGARGPIAGMLHSLFLLLFMLVAAPLAAYIPLAALAAVLMMVCWNMADRHQFATLLRASRGDAVVLLSTFLVVVFDDLTTGILVGFGLGTLLFMHRMAQAVEVRARMPVAETDSGHHDSDQAFDPKLAMSRDVIVYRISGAFFFGAAASVGAALDDLGVRARAYVIDMSGVPVLDSTAAATMAAFSEKARRAGAFIVIAGAARPILRVLLSAGLRRPEVRYRSNVPEAVATAREVLALRTSDTVKSLTTLAAHPAL